METIRLRHYSRALAIDYALFTPMRLCTLVLPHGLTIRANVGTLISGETHRIIFSDGQGWFYGFDRKPSYDDFE